LISLPDRKRPYLSCMPRAKHGWHKVWPQLIFVEYVNEIINEWVNHSRYEYKSTYGFCRYFKQRTFDSTNVDWGIDTCKVLR
jgi:hypothetical protein